MPWNYDNYPQTFKYLSDETRRKAVDIANALLRQGMHEKGAIRIARDQAVDWARSRHPTQSGLNQHVILTDGGWGVQSEDADQPSLVFPTKEEAFNRAREIAQTYLSDVIIHGVDGKIQERSKYA